ncbi:MAG: hypothetical protein E7478_04070, partial [Ruminococcaceae bacterium]|nr:hypothetical protein [Oscillospiraceae bacterium]
MIFNMKKAAAAATAIVCAASMCGCAYDSGYIGTVDGTEVRNGVYLAYMMRAYSNSRDEIIEAKEAQGNTSEVGDVFVETINGKPANDWIKEDTVRLIRRHMAVQKLFESKEGLELTQEEISKISSDLNKTWDAEEIDYYGIGYMMAVSGIYGTDTMGEYYESVGIGLESMKELDLNNLREEKLFNKLYDTNGETPVTDEEYNKYLSENYAVVKYIELPYMDKYDLSLTDEADIQVVKDKANSYADRLNNGESFFDIRYEVDLAEAQDEAAVEAENAFEDETFEAPTEEEFDAAINEAIAGATAEKYENDADVETVISKEYSSLDAELTEYIWNLTADDKATVF